MNINATQERLNSLPPNQQTLQYLQMAMNNQNPNVPSWMALIRFNEIQRQMQSAAQSQAQQQGGEQPQGTVKDKITQSTGIMALQKSKQQAAMQQMMQQAAQNPGQQPVQMPPQPAGIQTVAPQQGLRAGGEVVYYANGGGVEDEAPTYDRAALPSYEQLQGRAAGLPNLGNPDAPNPYANDVEQDLRMHVDAINPNPNVIIARLSADKSLSLNDKLSIYANLMGLRNMPAGVKSLQQGPGGVGVRYERRFADGGQVQRFAPGGVAMSPQTEAEVQEFLKREKEQEEEAKRNREAAQAKYEAAVAEKVPVPRDYNEIAKEEYRRMGVEDPSAAYAAQEARIAELQRRAAVDEEQRAKERGSMDRMGFWNSLMAAGEATRGARGSGLAALARGYGTAQNAANAAAIEERRKSDAEMMRRQADINELMSGVTTSRIGSAEKFAKRGTDYAGDVAGAGAQERKDRIGLGQDIFRADSKPTSNRDAASLLRGMISGDVQAARDAAREARAGAGAANAEIRERRAQIVAQINAAKNNVDSLIRQQKDLRTDYNQGSIGVRNAKSSDINNTIAAERANISRLQLELDALDGKVGAPSPAAAGASAAPAAPSSAAPAASSLPSPKSRAELDKLPPGTRYQAPDGTIRVKQ